jgi:site-specific DNA recombinase
MKHKYFLYLRKSTDREDMQAQSIDSQRDVCQLYARQNDLDIKDVIVERESAKGPGRPLFTSMIARIQRGEAQGIIAYHPDRLARNSKDGGEIVYLLDTGELKDLKFPTFWFENSPQGKFMIGMEFVQSKRYTDNLSVVTKRGLVAKCQKGFFPSQAPRGYLNDRATKTIIIDPQVGPLVQKMFARYAQGNTSVEHLQEMLRKGGLVSAKTKKHPGGKPIHVSLIAEMLSNPFYHGQFCYAGEVYEGKHEPLISKALFDRVQTIVERRGRPAPEKEVLKPFLRLFKCATCGMSVTGESQKGHTYYHCTRKSKAVKCKQEFVREEELERELSSLLSLFALPPDVTAQFLATIDQEHSRASAGAQTAIASKREALGLVQESLKRVLELYLGQQIDREAYTEQQVKLQGEKKSLLEEIRRIEDNQSCWLEPLRAFVKTAETVGFTAENGSAWDKKELAFEIFGSNLTLDRKKPRGIALKPWNLLQKTWHH